MQVNKEQLIKKSTWYLESGSRHMTGEKELLSEVLKYRGPRITFGDDSKGKTVGFHQKASYNKRLFDEIKSYLLHRNGIKIPA